MTQLTDNIYAVQVPEYGNGFKMSGRWLMYDTQPKGTGMIKLPSNQFEIIGLSP